MNELIEIKPENAITVFSERSSLQKILDTIKEETVNFVPDITTAKGRKEIASIANKVARSKTTIDAVGKDLVSDWKAKAKAVDAERKYAREFLDNLKVEVRKPLTEWEEQKKREEEEELRKKQEAERLEQERLEAERIAREEEIRKKEEAIAERERKLKEEEELKRIQQEAAMQAKLDAERAIQAEKDAAERRVREERERAEKAIKEAQAEQQRLEYERLQKEVEAKKQEEARLADRNHRAKINGTAAKCFMEALGCDMDTAKSIVIAIASNEIPNVKINY